MSTIPSKEDIEKWRNRIKKEGTQWVKDQIDSGTVKEKWKINIANRMIEDEHKQKIISLKKEKNLISWAALIISGISILISILISIYLASK